MDSIGRTTVVGEDDAWILDEGTARRRRVVQWLRPLVIGESVRDWALFNVPGVLYPYTALGGEPVDSHESIVSRYLWPYRTSLAVRSVFGKSMSEGGKRWYEHLEHYVDKLRTPLSIAFAFVATHNHFVLDRGGKVFNRSAPVVKLKPGATEDDHYALLGLLNSSVACFWMKQVFYPKAGSGMGRGIQPEAWMDRYEFDGTKVQPFPIPEGTVRDRARAIDEIASKGARLLQVVLDQAGGPSSEGLRRAAAEHALLHGRLIALQEELDWECYALYGLTSEPMTCAPEHVPRLDFGDRAFEIHLARRVAAGELTTAWFERHGANARTEIPESWPKAYREVVERRLAAIEAIHEMGLIERPEYKRRWSGEPWAERERRALEAWLLYRLETSTYWPEPRPTSTARLADLARHDADFLRVAALYQGADAGLDVESLVRDLVLGEAVPFLAAHRYTAPGLVKRRAWERAWDLQRAEDVIDARARLPAGDPARLTEDGARTLKAKEIGEIQVPPKYDTRDFRGGATWRLRGKLDVPKERFILYPGAERDADPTPVVGWAGWDHLQQAQALAAYVVERAEKDGWGAERLTPLLAGIEELLPWLKQWHNERQAEYGMGMGDYFERFLDGQVRLLGIARESLRAWRPPNGGGPRRRAPKKPREDE